MEGESREMSVLFSDVRGFTTISEGLDPKQLSRLMNEFLTPLTQVIYRRRGTIDKYMGDCIMAFWGAPIDDPQHARNAVLAGLEMQATMKALQPQFHSRGWPELHIGVGVNTGRMSVGNMGSDDPGRLHGDGRRGEPGLAPGRADQALWRRHDRRRGHALRRAGHTVPRAGPGDAEGQEGAGIAIFEPIGPGASVDAARQDELSLWHQALSQYRAQEWDMAELQLIDLQRRFPGTVLYATFLERIAHFRSQSTWRRLGRLPGPSRRSRAMQLRVLGCSGGIGGNLRTTSMLLDHDVLIDAGTGVADLTLSDLKQIDHIFVTHSHLDHIACIPFLVDTVGGMRAVPVTVHATRETLDILRDAPVQLEDLAGLHADSERAGALPPVRRDPRGGAGPTSTGAPSPRCRRTMWCRRWVSSWTAERRASCSPAIRRPTTRSGRRSTVSRICAISSSRPPSPTASGSSPSTPSTCAPAMLADELAKLTRPARVFITHLKPGEGAQTMEEVEQIAGAYNPRMLFNGQVFKF